MQLDCSDACRRPARPDRPACAVRFTAGAGKPSSATLEQATEQTAAQLAEIAQLAVFGVSQQAAEDLAAHLPTLARKQVAHRALQQVGQSPAAGCTTRGTTLLAERAEHDWGKQGHQGLNLAAAEPGPLGQALFGDCLALTEHMAEYALSGGGVARAEKIINPAKNRAIVIFLHGAGQGLLTVAGLSVVGQHADQNRQCCIYRAARRLGRCANLTSQRIKRIRVEVGRERLE